jgi:hypothetical protein
MKQHCKGRRGYNCHITRFSTQCRSRGGNDLPIVSLYDQFLRLDLTYHERRVVGRHAAQVGNARGNVAVVEIEDFIQHKETDKTRPKTGAFLTREFAVEEHHC